jgi:cytoskeletal protein RodZ
MTNQQNTKTQRIFSIGIGVLLVVVFIGSVIFSWSLFFQTRFSNAASQNTPGQADKLPSLNPTSQPNSSKTDVNSLKTEVDRLNDVPNTDSYQFGTSTHCR